MPSGTDSDRFTAYAEDSFEVRHTLFYSSGSAERHVETDRCRGRRIEFEANGVKRSSVQDGPVLIPDLRDYIVSLGGEGPDLAESVFLSEDETDAIASGVNDVTARLESMVKEVVVTDPIAVRVRVRERWSRKLMVSQDGSNASVAGRVSLVSVDAGHTEQPPEARGKSSLCLAAHGASFAETELSGVVLRAVQQAKRLAAAAPPPTGEMLVLVSSRSSGVFMHEVVGHLLEADNAAQANAPYHGRIGSAIAPEAVTILDEGTPGEWGGSEFDDEGTPACRTVLIADGELNAYLTSAAFADNNMGSSGNGRRVSYRFPALPRMTRMGIDRGTADPQALLADVSKGLLIEDVGLARVDPRTGMYRVNIREGWVVEGGEATARFTGGAVTGQSDTSLMSIQAVASDFEWRPTLCLKRGQELPVASGGPSLLLGRHEIVAT